MTSLNLRCITTIVFCVAVFCMGTATLIAQESAREETLQWDNILLPYPHIYDYIGGYAALSRNSHTGELIITTNGITCCTTTGGDGYSPALGAKYIHRLNRSFFFSPRITLEGRGAAMKGNEISRSTLGTDNKPETVVYQNTLDVSITTLGSDLMMGVWLLRKQNVYLAGGLSLSAVMAASNSISESILAPSGITYARSGGTTQEVGSQPLSTRFLSVGLRAGAGILIPLKGAWYLNPEILYHVPVSGWSPDFSAWKSSMLQLQCGVMYRMERD
ncbi:MAG: hypothetical protein JNL32_05420 [Candidatus Kapabacteria bacterium]|nr:hypothetical protein [Candidatus Kapabacteria bacterium]